MKNYCYFLNSWDCRIDPVGRFRVPDHWLEQWHRYGAPALHTCTKGKRRDEETIGFSFDCLIENLTASKCN